LFDKKRHSGIHNTYIKRVTIYTVCFILFVFLALQPIVVVFLQPGSGL